MEAVAVALIVIIGNLSAVFLGGWIVFRITHPGESFRPKRLSRREIDQLPDTTSDSPTGSSPREVPDMVWADTSQRPVDDGDDDVQPLDKVQAISDEMDRALL